MKVVISLGGSIISQNEGLNSNYLRTFAKEIHKISKEHETYLVVGGGRLARKYIEAGREMGADERFLDLLGIGATRLNAMMVMASLGDLDIIKVPEKVEDVDESRRDKIFVMGGTVPGHSTDAVTAELAAHVGADLLINATNVDGVYDKDPRKEADARRLKRISTQDLLEIVQTNRYKAGESAVIDPKAAKIIHEKGIKTVVVDGRKVKNIIDAIKGKATGTVIEKRKAGI